VRTTITLEDDVAAEIRAEARRSGRSFKEVLNRLVRLGLRRERTTALAPFIVRARALGLRPGLDYDKVNELIEHVEGPLHR
jgi:predicted CopG family antitoxin